MEITNRYDIIIKYICLNDFRENNRTWPTVTTEIYKSHLDIITSGTFREYQKGKSGFLNYVNAFQDIELGIELAHEGFKPIPVTRDGTPLDGSHRVSSAMYHKKNLTSELVVNALEPCYGYDWFQKNNFEYDGYVINRLLALNADIRLAVIWPSSDQQNSLLNQLPHKLILSKINYNETVSHNLVVNAYLNEVWLGNYKNNYKGAWTKIESCFTKDLPVYLVLFDASDVNTVSLKESLRSSVGLGKHSIHITDNIDETIENANIFFCSNFERWSYLTRLNNSESFKNKITNLRRILADEGLTSGDFVVTKGSCMELFSYRKSVDIDLATVMQPLDLFDTFIDIEKVPFDEFNKNNFIYNGVKFWSYDQLISDRKSQKSQKSTNDYKLLMGEKPLMSIPRDLFLFYNRKAQTLKRYFLNFLLDINLYRPTRAIFRILKRLFSF